MSILAAARDNLGVSIPSLLAGILISTIVSRFLAKTKRIRYSVKVDRLALDSLLKRKQKDQRLSNK